MEQLSKDDILARKLFERMFQCHTEQELDDFFAKHPKLFNDSKHWKPLGGNESNFGVVENQQASPIAALIEKLINSIDAILMRKCYEKSIKPNSQSAPENMRDAVKRFFPENKNWDLRKFRRQQAENIQIIADGPKGNTSLIIYDNGEGQHPEDFEFTFLSLLRGNKNEIHFVQGKYNMGGSGAIVFCGTNGYQLIGSKRFDETGKFGFTLIRKHPLCAEEAQSKKNTWYEYLAINGKILAFDTTEMDLGLFNRKFKTGTIIKLYSYDLPSGISDISKDLNYSLNEYLFEPALPIFTIEKPERYPQTPIPQRELFGLKRRLEQEDSKYVADYFSEDYQDQEIGKTRVTSYVFKGRIEDKSAKESRKIIQREFFQNNMSIIFSINGQVHFHYTSEFITRSLKFPLLKDYLLIHVDCTEMNTKFRSQLSMASRDRFKEGKESRKLRAFLTEHLRKSKLAEIYKRRKDSITVEGEDTDEMIKSFTKSLPLNSELISLLNQTFKLDQKKDKKTREDGGDHKAAKKAREPFQGKRFPTYFRIKSNSEGRIPVAKIPLGGEKTMKFETDVENHYFVRVEEPGNLELALLNYEPNDKTGGDEAGLPKKIQDVFNVVKSSPNNGIIKVVLNPTQSVHIGDSIQIKVTLEGPGESFDEIFWVKISEPQTPKEKSKPKKEFDDEKLGLPPHTLVYKDENDEGTLTWDKLEDNNIVMGFDTVMHPLVEGNVLDRIFINMDCRVLKNYKIKLSTQEQYELADKRYITSVYFHTLFLYTITRKRNYIICRAKENGKEENVDLTDYLKDLFENYYSSFLLNFEMAELMESFSA